MKDEEKKKKGFRRIPEVLTQIREGWHAIFLEIGKAIGLFSYH